MPHLKPMTDLARRLCCWSWDCWCGFAGAALLLTRLYGSVQLLHGFARLALKQAGQRAGRALDGVDDGLFLQLAGAAEHPGGDRFANARVAYADAQPPEVVAVQVGKNAAHAVVAAVAAALLEARRARQQVKLVVGHQDVFGGDVVVVGRCAHRPARLVHEGVGAQKHAVGVGPAGFGRQPVQLAVGPQVERFDAIQLVNKPEPGVVPGSLVLTAGVAQTGDQPAVAHRDRQSSASPLSASPSPSSALSSSPMVSTSAPSSRASSASAASSPVPWVARM